MELMTERTSKHMELRIDRVSKQYRNKIAVDRFSATLHAGVTGLLGANGAGKTTLIRMICGVLTPTSGEITYNGVPVSEERYRSVLGYLPQEFGCYPEFSGRDFLLYFAALKGMPRCVKKESAHIFGRHEAAPRNCAGFAEQTAGVDPG